MSDRIPAPPERIVVIGAGIAALSAVRRLRREGFGGKLLVVGAEDVGPYARPPLSKGYLASPVADSGLLAIDGDAEFRELADVATGERAVQLDLEDGTVVTDRRVIYFDRALIATGVRARRLSVPGANSDGVYLLRDVADCAALRSRLSLPRRVAVVGAGFIGCEVAATLCSCGHQVTLIDQLDQPLARVLGNDAGALVAATHRRQGVDLHMGAGLERIEEDADGQTLHLTDGSIVEADLTVVGAGSTPNSDWLTSSGLDVSDGVRTDQYCRTSDPRVLAAGDVAKFWHPRLEAPIRIEHWTNAIEHGNAAAANMLSQGDDLQPHAPIPYVWSDQYEIKTQIFGFPDLADEQVLLPSESDPNRWTVLFGRNGLVVGVASAGQPRCAVQGRAAVACGAELAEAVEVLRT